MKHLKQLSFCLLLSAVLATSASAVLVPETMVAENLNGQQRVVKTYTLSPEIDPDILQEPDFDYDGFHYSWAYTTKTERPYLDTKSVTETVTVETSKNDLSLILEQMAPSVPYDDGEYVGELALDHTTLSTQAAGYTTKRSTVTETKVIANLDRNDMSYVPATTVKNGKTLSLSNVEWQVTGTALVGEALVPSQYQAVATYSGSNSYQSATGYVTTAEYSGEVTSSGIESITYTVVYTGEKLVAAPQGLAAALSSGPSHILAVLLILLLLAAAIAAFILLRRKNVCLYIPTGKAQDYKLVGRRSISKADPTIDIQELDPYPDGTLAVEIKKRAAKKLAGTKVSVICRDGTYTYSVGNGQGNDWHEFQLPSVSNAENTETEEAT